MIEIKKLWGALTYKDYLRAQENTEDFAKLSLLRAKDSSEEAVLDALSNSWLSTKPDYKTIEIKSLTTEQFINLMTVWQNGDILQICQQYNPNLNQLSSFVYLLGIVKGLGEYINGLKELYPVIFSGGEDSNAPVSDFMLCYGWLYIAENICKAFRYDLDKLLAKDVTEFLHFASYLKLKGDYEKEQIERYKKQ